MGEIAIIGSINVNTNKTFPNNLRYLFNSWSNPLQYTITSMWDLDIVCVQYVYAQSHGVYMMLVPC